MIEHVRELVDQQYVTAGSVYSILEDRVRRALRLFRWDNPDDLQKKVQEIFPNDRVAATMNEVYVVRLRPPISGTFKFEL